MKRKLLLLAVVTALALTAVVGVVLAETKYYGSIGATTYNSGSDVKSRTYAGNSGSYHYNLFVNLRAWGGSPNPLKDERGDSCYYCTTTNTVSLWGGYYAHYTARHSGKMENSASWPSWVTYTSRSGYQSSYNCWVNNQYC